DLELGAAVWAEAAVGRLVAELEADVGVEQLAGRRQDAAAAGHPAELECDVAAAKLPLAPDRSRADPHRHVQGVGGDRGQVELRRHRLVVLAGRDPQPAAALLAAHRRQGEQLARDVQPAVHLASSQVAPTPTSTTSGGAGGDGGTLSAAATAARAA